ncbi:MAG: chemotaxis protein CheW [Acidihalobacter sp.]|jgi:twitching motility protein PilI
MTEVVQSPFDLLVQIERKCRVAAPGLPVHEEERRQWNGVFFRLRGFELVMPIEQVAEIVDMPSVSSIPGVKPWVVGLANMRGNLLPVVDLGRFLFGDDVAAQGRLLVIRYAGSLVGLRVDAVYGMRHFWLDQQAESVPELRPALQPYVYDAYYEQDKIWPVFDANALVTNAEFQNAAA